MAYVHTRVVLVLYLNLPSPVLLRFHASKFSLYSTAHFTDRTYDYTRNFSYFQNKVSSILHCNFIPLNHSISSSFLNGGGRGRVEKCISQEPKICKGVQGTQNISFYFVGGRGGGFILLKNAYKKRNAWKIFSLVPLLLHQFFHHGATFFNSLLRYEKHCRCTHKEEKSLCRKIAILKIQNTCMGTFTVDLSPLPPLPPPRP